jgi:hypothetical protein
MATFHVVARGGDEVTPAEADTAAEAAKQKFVSDLDEVPLEHGVVWTYFVIDESGEISGHGFTARVVVDTERPGGSPGERVMAALEAARNGTEGE